MNSEMLEFEAILLNEDRKDEDGAMVALERPFVFEGIIDLQKRLQLRCARNV